MNCYICNISYKCKTMRSESHIIKGWWSASLRIYLEMKIYKWSLLLCFSHISYEQVVTLELKSWKVLLWDWLIANSSVCILWMRKCPVIRTSCTETILQKMFRKSYILSYNWFVVHNMSLKDTSPAGSLLAVKLHSENGVIFKGKYEILILLILQWQDNPRKTRRNQLS